IKLKKLSKTNGTVIYLNYPIEEEIDLKTLDEFIYFVVNNPGFWFYSPMPNDFIQVDKVSLFGLNPIPNIQIFKCLKLLTYSLLSNFYYKRKKTKLLKFLKLFKKIIYRVKLFDNKKGEINQESDKTIKPKKQIPIELTILSLNNWRTWSPNNNIILRDLTKRVKFFFPHPKSIHVILLNKCNLKCIMCPYHSPKYTKHHKSNYLKNSKIMSDEIYYKILNYASKNKINLHFGQIEEPLLHPKIFDFFKLSKKKGVPYIHLTTNGTLLDNNKIKLLSESGVDSVMFSLDAANPDTYKRIRGYDLFKVESYIKDFMKLTKKHHIKVTVSFILQEQASLECNKFLEKWHGIGVDSVTFYVLSEHDPDTGAVLKRNELYSKGKRYPCASPWLQSVVFPEGEVSLCCKTMVDVGWKGLIDVGSLKDQNFLDIWFGERYNQVRKELFNERFEDFSVCTDCQIWSAESYITEKYKNYYKVYNETMETFYFR
ncbi:MAG: hypothetical protein APR54_07205, partial [Candidatus Cloacimonas sp. SDB]